jgi:hypothetical protein
MSDKASVWQDGLEVMNALTPFYQEEAVARIREAQAQDAWFVLLTCAGAEPDALTADALAALAPYTAPDQREERLGKALQGGFLSEESPGHYRLTVSGREALAAFFDYAQAAIAAVPVLDTADLETVARLLQRIVEATAGLPEPASKNNLAGSRWTDPGPEGAVMARIDQYLTDLQRYRDDAHIAAWQPYGVGGRSWEAFTLLWRDQAHTAGELVENLPYRGYSADDYGETLQSLARQGWIEAVGDTWRVTRRGRALREEAEEATDAYFYAGWDTLDSTELELLGSLLAQLLAALREAAPVAEGS